MRSVLIAAFVCSLTAVAEETPAANAQKLGVLPFASLSGDVPARAGVKASGMLSTELKNAEGLQFIDLRKVASADAAGAEALEGARKLVDDAKDQRKKKKFRLASEALAKAVAAYRSNAGAVTDIGEVVDAYALLAAVQYNTGRDDEGLASLKAALGLAPDRDLPLAATSQLFARVVSDTRKTVKDGAKGVLQLETTPSGAAVLVDGVPLGNTPLLVKEVPAGSHFWRASLANGEVLGGVAEVASGKTAKVTGASQAKDPESRLLSSVSQNHLDADMVKAAKELSDASGLDLLVFGTLSREGKGLALDSFVYAAKGNEVRRLERASFDTELLSAGMEFFKIASALSTKGGKSGDAVKVPSPVLPNTGPGGVKLAEAKYGVQPGKDTLDVGEPDTTGTTKDEGSRKPLGGGDGKRSPLKKKP
ncbi:MAG: PEGA domain-containing protein [Archangiaceae bacterium]|nr:PEGA domain-containing protein [Archangiaceae bacterium]